MSRHTPVVFADEPEMQATARDRHWAIVERQPGTPPILRIKGVPATCTIPQPGMSLRSGSLDAASWTKVLDWLERYVHKPLPVVAANHYATELALWAAASRGWPVGALVHGAAPVLSPEAIALFTAADGFLIPEEELARSFSSTWVGPVRHLDTSALVDIPEMRPTAPTRRDDKSTRVLLVAYYTGTSPTVGVHRVNYWLEQMETLSGGRVTVDLASATPWDQTPHNVRHVKDLGIANLAADGLPLEPWARALLEHADGSDYPIVHTPGGFWHLALERYFDSTDDEYDVVICSGNPYGYFEFANYAKRRWYARTILDYRDPFVGNPRAVWRPEAREAAHQLEAGWNMHADLVLAVNDVAASVAVSGVAETRVEVIHNGFDERTPRPLGSRQQDGTIRFGHAGQVYQITPPDNLLAALADKRGEFHQFGAHLEHQGGAHVVNHGRVPRDEVLVELASLDCGVTFAGDSGIETPTKVFDYLAAGLDVLVLHTADPRRSALWQMLEGTEGIHWVPDEANAIAAWLEAYTPAEHQDPSRAEPFSRRVSTLKLIDLILELGDHSFKPQTDL